MSALLPWYPPDENGPTDGPRWTVSTANATLYGTRVPVGMTFGLRMR